MRKYIIIFLILVACQPDELMEVQPLPQYEMIFEETISKVINGQEYSFEVLTTEEHILLITELNGSVISKETIIPTIGINTKIIYTKSLPKEELYLSLISSDIEIEKTTIIVE
tara:strand:+ start:1062 stop:1400 length:339 start_codon:yes stop_codon:yes gene_type:complete